MIKRGIVLEVCAGYAIVLNDDSEYEKIVLKKGLAEGGRIIYTLEDICSGKAASSRNWSRWLASAAVFFAVFGFAMLPEMLFAARVYAVVSMDINPSIQYYLDESETVIRVEAMNADGKELLRREMEGMDIGEAIECTLERAEESNYLKKNGKVLISAACLKNKDDDFAEVLAQKVFDDEIIEEKGIEVLVLEADDEDFKASKKTDASIGKYKVYEFEKDEFGTTLEEICEMKASEIIDGNLVDDEKTRVIRNRNKDFDEKSLEKLGEESNGDIDEEADNEKAHGNEIAISDEILPGVVDAKFDESAVKYKKEIIGQKAGELLKENGKAYSFIKEVSVDADVEMKDVKTGESVKTNVEEIAGFENEVLATKPKDKNKVDLKVAKSTKNENSQRTESKTEKNFKTIADLPSKAKTEEAKKVAAVNSEVMVGQIKDKHPGNSTKKRVNVKTEKISGAKEIAAAKTSFRDKEPGAPPGNTCGKGPSAKGERKETKNKNTSSGVTQK